MQSTESLEASIRRLEQTVLSLQKDIETLKVHKKNNIFLFVTSENIDQVLPAFIIAAGAKAMEIEVSMFFTFMGLSAVRKKRILSKKTITEKMMSMMTARSFKHLPMSKNNMLGIGPQFLNLIMKQHNVVSTEDLYRVCIESHVKMIACQMTMDIMGVTKEELIDSLEYAGVGYAINKAMQANFALLF